MLIAQLSDFHYRQNGTRLFGYVDVHKATAEAVAWVNAHVPAIDAVIITGDLVNDGGADDYAALKAVLADLAPPFAVITGNHDSRSPLAETFPLQDDAPVNGKYCWVRDFGDLRVIGLDTLIEGEPSGELGVKQCTWLDTTLNRAPQKPTLVALHHPPFETGIGFMDAFPLKDADRLAAVIARHSNVVAVLSGHIHRVIHHRFAETIAMTGPGTAHQVVMDLTDEETPRWIMEPAGCLLHKWTAGTGLVSHAAWFGDYGPEARFHSHHGQVPIADQSTR